MIHVMAPLPAVHFLDAVATAERMGSVLLGSNQFELLEKLSEQIGKEIVTVWLVASTGYLPKGELPPVPVGKVLYRGNLLSVEDADRRGRPKRPELRPASTAADTEWHKFYEVGHVTKLPTTIASASLRKTGGGVIEVAPHMLVRIERPEGAVE